MTEVARPAEDGPATNLALNRRRLFAGAGAAGALAVVAAALPTAQKEAEQMAAAPAAGAAPAEAGYRLTEHIKQYYASARV